MTAIYGLYDRPEAAQRACTGLKHAGIPSQDIAVISGEPFEAFEFMHRDHSMILFRLALIGGILGFLGAVGMVVGTEKAWPLVTGGMPIVAWYPNLVIIFEMTMLGAIVTTVISLLVTAKLPRFGKTLYDPAVADGKILVGVPAGGKADAIRETFTSSGASAVKTIEL
ncbi:MAG TPA: quinol:electron acceptor oxidoreductase subunit ActD [Vicinamibacterales bacterium]|nr:quinol:electron acceptor oxidoreductase subunit ActD [Vicinamibacterales bacterium]